MAATFCVTKKFWLCSGTYLYHMFYLSSQSTEKWGLEMENDKMANPTTLQPIIWFYNVARSGLVQANPPPCWPASALPAWGNSTRGSFKAWPRPRQGRAGRPRGRAWCAFTFIFSKRTYKYILEGKKTWMLSTSTQARQASLPAPEPHKPRSRTISVPAGLKDILNDLSKEVLV